MRALVFVMPFLFLFSPVGAQPVEFVTVGDVGNAPDQNSIGRVDYPYAIGKFEITNSQYVEFLNSIAIVDVAGLYHRAMADDWTGGIDRIQGDDISYVAKAGRENWPVAGVSFWGALRFVNWLENGQPIGPQDINTTEDGAYTITAEGIANNKIVRNEDARFVIPSEDEWYKAAYYKGGGLDTGYWNYPTQSDEAPLVFEPPRQANYRFRFSGPTDVGFFPNAPGPYGTFDQAGNVNEWNETIVMGDSNLDGAVDSRDLNEVGINWQRHDVFNWTDGNFSVDANPGVNSSDLNALATNWQQSSASAAVAEPSAFGLLLVATTFGTTVRRRARQASCSRKLPI